MQYSAWSETRRHSHSRNDLCVGTCTILSNLSSNSSAWVSKDRNWSHKIMHCWTHFHTYIQDKYVQIQARQAQAQVHCILVQVHCTDICKINWGFLARLHGNTCYFPTDSGVLEIWRCTAEFLDFGPEILTRAALLVSIVQKNDAASFRPWGRR